MHDEIGMEDFTCITSAWGQNLLSIAFLIISLPLSLIIDSLRKWKKTLGEQLFFYLILTNREDLVDKIEIRRIGGKGVNYLMLNFLILRETKVGQNQNTTCTSRKHILMNSDVSIGMRVVKN